MKRCETLSFCPFPGESQAEGELQRLNYLQPQGQTSLEGGLWRRKPWAILEVFWFFFSISLLLRYPYTFPNTQWALAGCAHLPPPCLALNLILKRVQKETVHVLD